MKEPASEQEYLLRSVVINEIIFGQPKEYYDWRVGEEKLAAINFDQYYILITGLERKVYRAFFGMEAQEYGQYFGHLQLEIEMLMQTLGVSCLSTMLLYDHSKRFCMIFSHPSGISAMDVARNVADCFNRLYAQIFDMNSMPYRNYTVLSERICGYDNLAHAFQAISSLYEQQFFDMQETIMTPALLKACQTAPDTEKLHEDQRQLRMAIRAKDIQGARQHYDALMDQLKGARNFTLLRSELFAIREMMNGLLKSSGMSFSDIGIDEENITERQYATFDLMCRQLWERLLRCMGIARDTTPLSGHMQEAVRFIRHHYADPISVSDVAEYVGMSSSWVSRHFVCECGCSMTAYLQQRRIEKACCLLCETQKTVGSIAEAVGIENAQYFASVFKKNMGMTPSEYRRRQRDHCEYMEQDRN